MKYQYYICFLAIVSFLMGGCASGRPSKVVLKHPATLDFVNCNVDRWETDKSYRTNEECVRKYQEEGYVIWGQR